MALPASHSVLAVASYSICFWTTPAVFLTFLPQFVDPARGSVTLQVLVLAALFNLLGLAILVAVALAAGRIGTGLRRHPVLQKLQTWLAASVLALHHRRLFPVLNYETPDPECPVAAVTDAETPAGDTCVNLSVTPQGQASAVLVARFQA